MTNLLSFIEWFYRKSPRETAIELVAQYCTNPTPQNYETARQYIGNNAERIEQSNAFAMALDAIHQSLESKVT